MLLPTATDLLFVYGSLRRGFPLHHHLSRLRAEFVGRGSVQGVASNLGKFPGARNSSKPWTRLAGELYRLHQVENALKILDQVEGFSPRTPGKGLFQRATAEVVLLNKEQRLAWIYWCR